MLSRKEEALLVATAWSSPPAGRARWTLELLAGALVKLTEHETSGMRMCGLRAWDEEALQRRVAAVEATGLGEGWNDGDRGRGPSYRFRDPDGHLFELYYEVDRYEDNLQRARDMAGKDPRAVAMVLRSWMSKDEK